jgi:hypothetical protein
MTLPQLFCRTIPGVATLLGGLSVAGPVAVHAAPLARAIQPFAAACAEDCTRKASDCIDACEEKFKNDDKGRVTCKFECATKRQQCEKDCQ